MRTIYHESVNYIYLLLQEVLPPIESIGDEVIFVLSIDGTHCPIQEPTPWDSKWKSHKLGCAGVAYEVGLRIHSNDLAWVHGPYPAGEFNDLKIFRDKLKGKLECLNSTLTVKKRVSSAVLYIMISYHYINLPNKKLLLFYEHYCWPWVHRWISIG